MKLVHAETSAPLVHPECKIFNTAAKPRSLRLMPLDEIMHTIMLAKAKGMHVNTLEA